ncbi:hypothetical protein [Agilicoccus flavus]|nr:hypothetical protein [Agilicoccus flavus]
MAGMSPRSTRVEETLSGVFTVVQGALIRSTQVEPHEVADAV